jgi:polysaccharide export outer membrane protein
LDQDAGYKLRISRDTAAGSIPLPAAQLNAAGEYEVAEINVRELLEGKHPEQNVLILPGDTISVPRSRLVYVIGEVHRAGGFVLRDSENLSVLQALSLAEGLAPTAGAQNARILRPNAEGTKKDEIKVNVKEILAGKSPDVPLRADDVLFIPNSAAKSATIRGVETAIQMGTGLVIWHR